MTKRIGLAFIVKNNKDQTIINPNINDLIPLSKAAKISGLSPNHLRLLVGRGDVWGMKIGRNWVTTEKAMEDYLAHNRKRGPKPKLSK